ncbi:hypothetical protein [Streptomyces sp. NPDC001914]|uniref:hypothetical protein n=1 Tax=Streptomyces sp. NPDC001914 TaxID=3364623 RepID=UPI00368FB498
MHRTITALAAVCLLIGAAAGCSNDSEDSKGTSRRPAAAASTAHPSPKKLADYYSDKFDAVSDDSVSECQTPSSTTCATDLGAIMAVVDDLEDDIDARGGAAEYPKSTKQIAQMRAAQREYEENECEADPAADDPNSDCWGIVNITLGSTTLSFALQTDELT